MFTGEPLLERAGGFNLKTLELFDVSTFGAAFKALNIEDENVERKLIAFIQAISEIE